MFSNELSKSATVNDSNIPVPKRTLAGTKRPKGCAQLPELQRYIETIIKVSSECDSEEALPTQKGNKMPRDRKFGRYSVKGNDNRAKTDKIKYDFQMSGRKSKNKSKTAFKEAVSDGAVISKMFDHDFEDPRNWKTDVAQNTGCNPEIEKFLKKIFPNPYHLENVDEIQKLVFDKVPERNQQKDDSGDETLARVPLSNAHTQTEVESEKPDDASLCADCQIKQCPRGSATTCAIGSAASLENCSRPVSRKGSRRGSAASVRSKSNRVSTPSKRLPEHRSSNSTTNISSRPSSLESVSDVFSSHTQTISPDRKNGAAVSSKSSLNEIRQKSSIEDFLDEIPSDYDLGKLKLLNITDSDDSVLKNSDLKKAEASDHNLKYEPSRTFFNAISSTNNLQQVTDKVSDSFIELSLKNNLDSVMDISRKMEENKKLTEYITKSMDRKDATGRTEPGRQEENKKKGNSRYTPPKEIGVNNSKSKLENEKTNEIKEVESCIIKLMAKEEKLELTEQETQLWGEEEQKQSLKQDTDTSSNVDDLDQVIEDDNAEQKIDEVLQFMYDCLKKFSNQEEKHSEEVEGILVKAKKEIEKENFLSDNEKDKPRQPSKHSSDSQTTEGSSESLLVKSSTRRKESTRSLDETKKKSFTRPRNRKKQDKNSSVLELPPHPTSVSRSSTSGRSLEVHSTADSPGITTPIRVQTVESQNELGSYSEQSQIWSSGCNDTHTPKSILPHSVKLKKSKTYTQKTIKDVLESEEKLLANYLSSKPTEKKSLEKGGDPKSRKLVMKNSRATAYPLFSDFKRNNSNFVICVSSLPRNLRTIAANRTSLTLSPSFSFSLSDIGRIWDIKPLPYYPKTTMKKIPVISDIGRSVDKFSYKITEGRLLILGKGLAFYTAIPVCLKLTANSSTLQENSFKASECFLTSRVKPIKKSLFVECSGCFNGHNLTPVGNCETAATETESNQKVDYLLEALEKTEGRLKLLEQNELESMSNYSGKEKHENSDWEAESGQEKVHDLLLRTYSLQHKLHRYLHKMSCIQPAFSVCPLAQLEQCSRLAAFVKESTNLERKKPETVQTAQESKSEPEEGTTEIQKSDQATSNSPQSDESKNSTDPDTKEERQEEHQNEDDDNSSVYSFKSSNDFSETNETVIEKDSKAPAKVSSKEFLNKIFSEIESFKENFPAEDKKCEPSSGDSNQDNSEHEEKALAEYDPKMPAKVLKTVFKGKKSVTELTIGLKDVPLTQVSNISVEKRKFSPNHTKISICIHKERPDALERTNSIQESVFKANSDVLHKKYSTLYFDQIRPSLSRCRTEYSKIEDDISKTTGSAHESSEDDDDDYKSVVSSFSTPDLLNDRKETKNDSSKQTAPAPPKTFTKYRFDFYRKMDMNADLPKPKPISSTVCRYKELEPLKQALTEMQLRMRSIKHDAFFSSNDYYERALKLAKMSAGYCQSCGNRSVIPKDTFGYYKTLLPRRYSTHRHGRHFKVTANPSYYSFRSSNPEVSDNFCNLELKHSSSYVLNQSTRPAGPFLRSSLHDMPILIQRMQ